MRAFSGVSLALVTAVTVVSAVGCAQAARLQANRSFKAANMAYQSQDYAKAAALYDEVLETNPEVHAAHFFLANSHDNLYRAARAGEPENDAHLTKAVDHYTIAADTLLASDAEDEKSLGKLSLEYLAAVYGADKLNDPASAEPVVQRLIALEPTEPTNYFALARIYDEAGAYEEAEQTLLKARDMRPSDPAVYMQLANYYNQHGDFEKTMDALAQRATQEPNNPEAFFTISTYYWDNAQRNSKLRDAEKLDFAEKGLVAVDRAIQLRADYMDAIVYRGLLLRVKAGVEKDRAKYDALMKEAEAMQKQAEEIRVRRAEGV